MVEQKYSEWYPSAPLATASNCSSNYSSPRKASLSKNLSLPPTSSRSNLSIDNPLIRSASCKRKVTWQNSVSNNSLASYSFCNYPFNEPVYEFEQEPETLSTCCGHLLKLVVLVVVCMVVVFLIQCFMYFLYTVILDVVTPAQYIHSSAKNDKHLKSLRDMLGIINDTYHSETASPTTL